jgi:hypothetical protein
LRKGPAEGWPARLRAVLPAAEFAPPATDAQLDAVEADLGQPLPPVLRELLRETNGVRGDAYGLGLVWDAERISRDNKYFRDSEDFRQLYMPFTPLLFFGDAGNGDQFAFVRQPVRDDDIYAWNHEDDSRTWVAPRLAVFFEWWGDGRIRL